MSPSSVQPVLALLGYPVGGNPTQYMVEQTFLHHELDWRFLSLEVAPEELGAAVRGMRAMGFRGGACADPHKGAVLQFLDRITPAAELIGQSNCIYRDEHGLVGDNTEGRGLVEALGRRVDPAGKKVVLLGAGGMALPIAVEVANARPAEILVVDCHPTPGQSLVEVLSNRLQVQASLLVRQKGEAMPPGAAVWIDTTLPGSAAAESVAPCWEETVAPTVVAGVSLSPVRTPLLRWAADRGCMVVDGLEVFIDQMVLNFRFWSGISPDPSVLREAAEEFLEL